MSNVEDIDAASSLEATTALATPIRRTAGRKEPVILPASPASPSRPVSNRSQVEVPKDLPAEKADLFRDVVFGGASGRIPQSEYQQAMEAVGVTVEQASFGLAQTNALRRATAHLRASALGPPTSATEKAPCSSPPSPSPVTISIASDEVGLLPSVTERLRQAELTRSRAEQLEGIIEQARHGAIDQSFFKDQVSGLGFSVSEVRAAHQQLEQRISQQGNIPSSSSITRPSSPSPIGPQEVADFADAQRSFSQAY